MEKTIKCVCVFEKRIFKFDSVWKEKIWSVKERFSSVSVCWYVCVWERESVCVCAGSWLRNVLHYFITTYNNQRADIFWELSTGDVLRASRLSRTAQRTGYWKLPKPLGRHRQVCVPQKIYLSPRGGTHLYSVYPRYCKRLLWAVAAPAGCAPHQPLHCQIDTTLVPNSSTLNPRPSAPNPKLQTLIPNP